MTMKSKISFESECPSYKNKNKDNNHLYKNCQKH